MCVCQHHPPYKNSPLWSYTLYTENGRDNFWAFYNDSPLLLYHDWGTIIKVGRPYSFIYWNTKKRANNDGFWKQFQMTLWSLYYYLLIMASLSNSSDYWVHGGAGTYILCRNEWWFRFQRVQGNPGSGTYSFKNGASLRGSRCLIRPRFLWQVGFQNTTSSSNTVG